MKKVLFCLAALSALHTKHISAEQKSSDTAKESLLQEIEEIVSKDLKKPTSQSTVKKTTQKTAKRTPQLPPTITARPQVKLKEAPRLPLQKIQKVAAPKPSTPKVIPAATIANPQVTLINATNVPCTVTTAASMEQTDTFNQTKTKVKSYSSATMPLTNNTQQFMSAQMNASNVFNNTTNMMPISLTTPRAVVYTDSLTPEEADYTFQYLPNVEQNGIVIINPTSQTYTLNIMDTAAEQISAPANNPNYLILTVNVPARSTVPLPLLTNHGIRLHLQQAANAQVTKLAYPTAPGFYVLQELLPEQMPRKTFIFNDYTSGTSEYLYLQPIAAAS